MILVSVEASQISDPLLRQGLFSPKLIRTFTYTDRKLRGENYEHSGSFGAYDPIRDIAYLGVKDQTGRAITGAMYKNLPPKLFLNFKALNISEDVSAEKILGVRIDYFEGSEATKSVLISNAAVTSPTRTHELPWGKKGALEDRRLFNPKVGSGEALLLNLELHAPPNWMQSPRKAIISFWMEDTGPESQAEIYLFEKYLEAVSLHTP